MAARTTSTRVFLVRRTRDNLSCVFARRARRLGTHGLGVLEAISERNGRISIRNNEETERRGFDFWEMRNIPFYQWWTREYDANRNLLEISVLADGVGGGHAVVVEKLNNILGHTIEEDTGDEGGSGLSSIGGTSVVSFRLESVKYALETADGDTDVNYLRSEIGDYFVSEDLNTVIQRSDNTFLSVDTRSVDHGGTGGGGAGNPVKEGAVSGNTMTLTLNDNTTVDIDVTSLVVPDGITVDSPNWFQMFSSPGNGNSASGSQVTFTTHQAADVDKNPYYWGTELQPGQELIWTAGTGPKDMCLGIWAGATTYVPTF